MKSRLVTASLAVLLVAVISGGSWLAARYLSRPVVQSKPSEPLVEVAKPTPAAAEAERAPVAPATCSGLSEIVDAELLAEVARRHRLDGLARITSAPQANPGGKGEGTVAREGSPVLEPPGALATLEVHRALLALVETEQPARWGSEVAVTLADGASEVTVTSIPNPPPTFAPRSDRRLEFGLGGAASFGPDGSTVTPALFASFDLRLAQTRRVDHGLRVFGVLSEQSTVFAGYVVGWE